MRGVLVAMMLTLASVARAEVPLYVGQVEFVASGSFAMDYDSLHRVTNLGLMVDPGGKLVGYAEGENCKILGLWRDAYGGQKEFGATLTECVHPEYNGRYSGKLGPGKDGAVMGVSFEKYKAGIGTTWKATIHGKLFRR